MTKKSNLDRDIFLKIEMEKLGDKKPFNIFETSSALFQTQIKTFMIKIILVNWYKKIIEFKFLLF